MKDKEILIVSSQLKELEKSNKNLQFYKDEVENYKNLIAKNDRILYDKDSTVNNLR